MSVSLSVRQSSIVPVCRTSDALDFGIGKRGNVLKCERVKRLMYRCCTGSSGGHGQAIKVVCFASANDSKQPRCTNSSDKQ